MVPRARVSVWLSCTLAGCVLGAPVPGSDGASTARADSGHAEPPPVSLRWEAPAACPDASEVRAEMLRLLARAGPREPGGTLAAHVRVERAGGYRAHVELGGALSGERTLQAGDCHTLARAVALVVVLAWEPNGASAPREERPGTKRRSSPKASSAPTSTRVADADGSSSAPLDAALGIAGTLDTAVLPRLGGGVAARAVLGWGPWDAMIAFRYVLPQDVTVPRHDRASATFQLAGTAVGACYALWEAPVRVGPCVGLELGGIWARSRNVTQAAAKRVFWAAAEGAVMGQYAVGRLAVRGRAGILGALRRPRFVLDGESRVHEVPAVSVRLAVSLLWRLRRPAETNSAHAGH